jgi:hypothetical protein
MEVNIPPSVGRACRGLGLFVSHCGLPAFGGSESVAHDFAMHTFDPVGHGRGAVPRVNSRDPAFARLLQAESVCVWLQSYEHTAACEEALSMTLRFASAEDCQYDTVRERFCVMLQYALPPSRLLGWWWLRLRRWWRRRSWLVAVVVGAVVCVVVSIVAVLFVSSRLWPAWGTQQTCTPFEDNVSPRLVQATAGEFVCSAAGQGEATSDSWQLVEVLKVLFEFIFAILEILA